MVKPKFSPRIALKSNSKAKAVVSRKTYDEKQRQISAAVQYCQDNNYKGKKALNRPISSHQGSQIHCKKIVWGGGTW